MVVEKKAGLIGKLRGTMGTFITSLGRTKMLVVVIGFMLFMFWYFSDSIKLNDPCPVTSNGLARYYSSEKAKCVTVCSPSPAGRRRHFKPDLNRCMVIS